MGDTLSQNLRRQRNAAGMTQAKLADAAGISRVAYRNIETGSAEPRPETLLALARALGVKPPALLVETSPLRAVRFRARKRMRTRDQVLIDVQRRLTDYSELEDALDDQVPNAFSQVAESLASREPKAVAAAARRAANLRDDELIRDICGLLEDKGVKVLPVRLASNDFFGLSVAPNGSGPAIAVNVWERIAVERWIFSAAHELGHLILHLSEAFDVEQTEENPSEEKEADQFASHLLMPDSIFSKEWEEARGHSLVDRVLKIKRIFRVSYKTVLYRIQETMPIGGDIWKKFAWEYRQRFGRTLRFTEEPNGVAADSFSAAIAETLAAAEPEHMARSDFQTDRLARLVRTAVEEERITLARGAEILGIPLREMRQVAASWVA
ncbi:MAG TPA: XRE family transcriptional regulator [Kofleriaceae bacterium]|nr:XRE family transcriptional regulator [Kofleriaceae bacterium]